MAQNDSKRYVDLLTSYPYGTNSGVDPLLLPMQQTAWAINSTFRGGYATDRPPVQKLTLDFGGDAALEAAVRKGFFQGAGVYRPDFGSSQNIAQIGGRLFTFTDSGAAWTVKEITIPGDPNDPTTNQVWMWQAEKWMIISDGTSRFPIFYDGVSARRSYGPSVLLGTTNGAPFSAVSPALLGTGNVLSVTLIAPYTGPFNIPVSFNGAIYQTISNGAPSYSVILDNLSAVPASAIPSGSQITVQPDRIGFTTTTQTYFGRPSPQSFSLPMTSVSGVSIGDSIIVPVQPAIGPELNITMTVTGINPGTKTITAECSVGLFVTLNHSTQSGKLITFATSHGPAVIIGNTTAPAINPAIGSTLTVTIDLAYSGPSGQSVWIGNDEYTISEPPPGPPSTTLNLLNLTDTSAAAYNLTQTISTIGEIPACRMGAYGLGQNWFSTVDGLAFGPSDLVGSSSGTQANNYRDAVLKTTDLQVMGYFRLPNAGEIITSMTFVATLDQALGQGPLQIGVASGMFSVRAPFTLIDFQGLGTVNPVTSPILTKSLIGYGPIAQNSTILANSDTIYRGFDGVYSLILARRAFSDVGGNTPISREVTRAIELDNKTLLSYASAIVFDNRLRMTCHPQVSSQGVYHEGELVLNYDLLSSLRGKASPVWDGLWTGLNILQYTQGLFGPTSRAFAFTFNITGTQIELYELLPTGDQHFDNGKVRIKWVVESPVIFNAAIKTLTDFARLMDGEMYLAEVNGCVDVLVEYRPIFYPCWIYWHKFAICADMTKENAQEQMRYKLGFGEPDAKNCDTINDEPFREAPAFQVRFEFTGHCKLFASRFMAEQITGTAFGKPAPCDTECPPDV